MSALEYISNYASSGEEDSDDDSKSNDRNRSIELSMQSLRDKINLNATPGVATVDSTHSSKPVHPDTKVLNYNPTYERLYAPVLGPVNPFKTQQQNADKNTLSGFVDSAHINDFQFESQRRTFNSYGYAIDPTAEGGSGEGLSIVGNLEAAEKYNTATVFENVKRNERKKFKNSDASDVEGFLGPWAGYTDEKKCIKPSEDEQKEFDEITAKRQKRGRVTEGKEFVEKCILHIKDPYDYQGRSFLHIPQDVGVNLKSPDPPEKCFLPDKKIHTWSGHSKAVTAVTWFPVSAHLLLSCSMDHKIKLWEVYNERRCIMSYMGHHQAVRDICFNNDGTKFLSCGYDKYVKLWDTETGACVNKFTNKKISYCVRFNPDDDKQNFFVSGMADNKILCWDIRSEEIVQQYDRHLGAVNSITFVDENRKFITTSDDKSIRVWEWDIPVDVKYISHPTMHSMPAVTLSPNGKWLACQSMDNKIMIFSAINRFSLNRKKEFTGHMVAGYSCSLDFSPDMHYVVSGDADGKIYFWSWKTSKICKSFKAHDQVCISALWHPHETSKVATAGWDGKIHLWD